MSFDDCFKIGYVSKTHGLKGEVTAVIEIDIAWDDLTSLFLESRGTLVPYFIERISGTPGKPFIKLEGIRSLEQASSLKGSSIYALKSERVKLKRGEFYDDEVIGFVVEDKTLGRLGTIREIQSQGANRLLCILDGGKETLVPINAPFIKSVNKSKKLIQLELPDGFLNL